MAKYQIEVKVTIKECNEELSSNVKKQEDGSFKMVIDEVDAISIDKCEHAVLMANYPAIREAISRHLSELSKKRLEKEQPKGS
jgi:hypothetical protein